MSRPLRFAPLVASLLLAGCGTTAYAEGVQGTFALSQESYGVGEPILVTFSVMNDRSSRFSFDEGGDYRGTLRHHRFSFRVVDEGGRDFTDDPRNDEGGRGRQVDLEPRQVFRSLQVLGGWTHLLPPGRYRAHCERRLSLDSRAGQGSGRDRPPADAVAITQDLSFSVTPYRRDRIVKAVAAMHERETSPEARSTVESAPVEWVLADLNAKLALGIPYQGRSADFEKGVLAALPEAWDDAYYVEYHLRANRNWLTPEKPEDFVLTFSARNNGTTDLPHRLGESTLEVDGAPAAGWPKTLAAMLSGQRLGPTLAPGAVATIHARFNDALPTAGRAQLVWRVRGIAESVEVRMGR